jgi:hypothetical protein
VAVQINAAGTTTKLVFDGSASPLSSGAGPYTMAGWFRRDTDQGAGREWFAALGNGGAYAAFSVNADSFTKFDWNTGDSLTLGTATTGLWKYLAMVVSAGNSCTAYHGTSTSLTSVTAGNNLGSALGLLTLGVYPFVDGEYGRFSCAHLRFWSDDLSQAELEAEMVSPSAVISTGLWAAYEFPSSNTLNSASGTKNLTATGSDYAYVAGPISASSTPIAALARHYAMLRAAG